MRRHEILITLPPFVDQCFDPLTTGNNRDDYGHREETAETYNSVLSIVSSSPIGAASWSDPRTDDSTEPGGNLNPIVLQS